MPEWKLVNDIVTRFTNEVTKAQEITCQNYTAELTVKLSDSQMHAASILPC